MSVACNLQTQWVSLRSSSRWLFQLIGYTINLSYLFFTFCPCVWLVQVLEATAISGNKRNCKAGSHPAVYGKNRYQDIIPCWCTSTVFFKTIWCLMLLYTCTCSGHSKGCFAVGGEPWWQSLWDYSGIRLHQCQLLGCNRNHVCCSERLASRGITLLGLPQTWCLYHHTRPFGLNCGRLLAYDLGPRLPNYCHANPIRRRGNCMRRVIFMMLHLLSLYNVIFNRNCAVSTGHLQAVWYMGRLL